MMAASRKDGDDLVDLLLSRGADVNMTSMYALFHSSISFFQANTLVNLDNNGQVHHPPGSYPKSHPLIHI
jgi:hypothetical protein